MDGLSARGLDHIEDDIHAEVGVLGGRGSNTVSLVSFLHEHGVHVGVGVDCDGLDAHLLAGADDTARDLTSVCDQDLVEGLGE